MNAFRSLADAFGLPGRGVWSIHPCIPVSALYDRQIQFENLAML